MINRRRFLAGAAAAGLAALPGCRRLTHLGTLRYAAGRRAA